MTLWVGFTVLMWALLVGMIGWHVWKANRVKSPDFVSPQWRAAQRYKRSGDVPPGTSRQEERK